MSEQSSPEVKKYFSDGRAEQFSPIFETSLVHMMTEEEKKLIKTIVSIGCGDAIETPLLRSTFPDAHIKLVEMNEPLAKINARRFAQDANVESVHADASLPESKNLLKANLAIIRHPNVVGNENSWQRVLNNLSEVLDAKSIVYVTTFLDFEMDSILQLLAHSGFTLLEGEPRMFPTESVDDRYTVRAMRSKNP